MRRGIIASSNKRVHPLAYLFTGGYVGRILDGTWSKFFTDDGELNPCVTPEIDPVGFVEDGSNGNRNATQPLASNKCVFVENNGVRGWREGDISGVNRFLETTTPYGITTAPDGFTHATVLKRLSGSVWRYVLNKNGPPWVVWYCSGGNTYWFDNGSQTQVLSAPSPGIMLSRFDVSGDVEKLEVSNVDGSGQVVTDGSVIGYSDLGNTTWGLGANYSFGPHAPTEKFFDFAINRKLSDAELVVVRNYMTSAPFAGIV